MDATSVKEEPGSSTNLNDVSALLAGRLTAAQVMQVAAAQQGVTLTSADDDMVFTMPVSSGSMPAGSSIILPTILSSKQIELQLEDRKRREREALTRRPSYRKILGDLTDDCDKAAAGTSAAVAAALDQVAMATGASSTSGLSATVMPMNAPLQQQMVTTSVAGAPAAVLLQAVNSNPQQAQQIANALQQTITVSGTFPTAAVKSSAPILSNTTGNTGAVFTGSTNTNSASAAAIQQALASLNAAQGSSTGQTTAAALVQYAQGADGGAVLIPVGNAQYGGAQQLVLAAPSGTVTGQVAAASSASTAAVSGEGEGTRKREMRLLKNREAARECRRKKKEYVKCLENRVTVLELQNKQLIEELQKLKNLYCANEEAMSAAVAGVGVPGASTTVITANPVTVAPVSVAQQPQQQQQQQTQQPQQQQQQHLESLQ